MGQIKQIKGKVVFKHETEADWLLSSYVPDDGEKVLYDPDETYNYTRVKYGDGKNIVKDLPFTGDKFGINPEYDEDALLTVGSGIPNTYYLTDVQGIIKYCKEQYTAAFPTADFYCDGKLYNGICYFLKNNMYYYYDNGSENPDKTENIINTDWTIIEKYRTVTGSNPAPEFFTQITSANAFVIKADGAYINGEKVGANVENITDGEGEGSIKMGDINKNRAYGLNSVVEGSSNLAGLYGSTVTNVVNDYAIAVNGDIANYEPNDQLFVLREEEEGNSYPRTIESINSETGVITIKQSEPFGTNDYNCYVGDIVYSNKSVNQNGNEIYIKGGQNAHAEGINVQAVGDMSHAEGKLTSAIGNGSHAEGIETQAIGNGAHAEGYGTVANGDNSHAEGYRTLATGFGAHAGGVVTAGQILASGEGSFAHGHTGMPMDPDSDPTMSSYGGSVLAIGEGSFAVGSGSTDVGTELPHIALGDSSSVLGMSCRAEGLASIAMGHRAESYAEAAVAEGAGRAGRLFYVTFFKNAILYNDNAIKFQLSSTTRGITKVGNRWDESNVYTGELYKTTVFPLELHITDDYLNYTSIDFIEIGNDYYICKFYESKEKTEELLNIIWSTRANGQSFYLTCEARPSIGNKAFRKGQFSHAEGLGSTEGSYSHAEGDEAEAVGDASHAEGAYTLAHGYASHSEGYATIAKGDISHAEGEDTMAFGECSHAGGKGTIALAEAQTAIGKYNEENSEALFIVGAGTSDSARANAFTTGKNSNKEYYITVGSTTLTEKQLQKILSFIDTIEG